MPTKEGAFRFCGRDIEQPEEYSIDVTCKGTLEKVEPLAYYTKGRRKTDLATPGETSKRKSVVGSMSWVPRQCRPDMSYGVSKLQPVALKRRVEDLASANKFLRESLAHAVKGLTFKSGCLVGAT